MPSPRQKDGEIGVSAGKLHKAGLTDTTEESNESGAVAEFYHSPDSRSWPFGVHVFPKNAPGITQRKHNSAFCHMHCARGCAFFLAGMLRRGDKTG